MPAGQKTVILPCVELDEEGGFDFSEVAKGLRSAQFLRTQREKLEAARMRALTSSHGKQPKKGILAKVDRKAMRAKVKRKLLRAKRKEQLKEFLTEVRAREGEGYSTRQLMSSLIPDIGNEVKVADSEVTAALRSHEAANF